jgi:hypothetical protein
MELWMGGESQGDIFDELRTAKISVVKKVNEIIKTNSYDIPLESLNIIVILKNDNDYEELFLLCREQWDMDFRLKLDFKQFKESSAEEREKLIFSLVWRSLAILKRNHFDSESFTELVKDIALVGRDYSWI